MSHARNDAILVWLSRGCAASTGAIALLIVAFLGHASIPALRDVGLTRFFTDGSWHPSATAATGRFDLTAMLAGSLLVTAGAVALATPLGIASAVFRHFYAPRALALAYRKVIELLAGIPSVVYGFWGLVVLVPLIARWRQPGTSLLAGVVILAIMILPTVALVADSALASVPRDYPRAAAALGLSRWGTIRYVVLPAARSGLLTSIVLETGRAIGETMAVLMVCGNVARMPRSVFDPIRTLTANIALEMSYAMGAHRSALFVSGLVLMVVIVALVTLAEIIEKKPPRQELVGAEQP